MKRLTRMVVVFIALGSLIVGMNAYAAPLSGAASQHRPSAVPVAQGPVGPGYAFHPLWLKVRGYDRNGNPLFTGAQPLGYTPAQIQSYLGLKGDGSGQTVAIVDAYADPNIKSDLSTFDSQFGLAAPPSFTVTPEGKPSTNAGWALETSLDVEWAHAVAPQANLLLVEAASSSFANLMGAIDYAAQQAGVVVISNSWGAGEFSGESSYDSHCALAGKVCTFSSGDSGNPGGYPAYNPYVIAVGGTTLQLNSNDTRSSETAWSGSGGGVSQYESEPSYQSSVQATGMRGIPDVSYDADPNTGFAVYDSVKYHGQSGWFEVGGTSAGAPQWAAIIAAADQLRGSAGALGSSSFGADSALYGLPSGDIYDVTTGSNGSCGSVCDAGPGYDFVTGLGSPNPGIDQALAGSSSTTPTSGASLTPASESATIGPGDQYTYSFTLTNNGSGTASNTFALSLSAPSSGWSVSGLTPTSVTLAAGASTTVSFTVTAGTSTNTGGASETETLTATSGSVTASATATTTVGTAAVSISPSSESASIAAGNTISYTYTVANTGTVSDTYSLTASSAANWPTSILSGASLTLGAGQSASVVMNVTVPAGTTAGTSDTETLAATSTQYPDSATATAVTTALASSTATSASLQPVSWSSNGGRNHDKNVHATLTLDDNLGNPVSGATVSVAITVPSGQSLSGSATTNSSGSVTFTINGGGAGTYTLKVTSVQSTPQWDGSQPTGETYNNP